MMKTKPRKNQPLWVRLILYFLLLSVIILTLFQVIFNRSLERHLQAYTSGREEILNHQIVEALSQYYKTTGSWLGVQMPLIHAALSTNTRLLLYTANDRLVADSSQRMRLMMMTPRRKPDLDDYRVYNFEIEADESIAGKLIIAYPVTAEQSAWLRQDLVFRRALTRSLLLTGLIAASAALVLGIVFARRLSSPLEEIASATSRITRGDYDLQLPAYRGLELNDLAAGINRLAAHLRELEKLRSRSVADIAHELRTPLATLRSYVEAVKDGVMPPDARTMQILLNEIMHLAGIAEGLEELTRAEKIKHDQTIRETINLNSFLQDKIDSFQPHFQEKGLNLKLVLPEEILSASQDPFALHKIMRNLLDNAYRYTKPGGTVEVTLSEKPEIDPDAVAPLGQDIPEGSALEEQLINKFFIKISDTGSGIRKDYLPYIFERFFRADPARERDQGQTGSGIGLALVKELTRAAGGLILVSSSEGKGTTFYLYLKR